jgi:hypothetical protein
MAIRQEPALLVRLQEPPEPPLELPREPPPL